MTRFLFILLFAASLLLAAPASAADLYIHWTAPGDDGNVGTAKTYDIRYSTVPITETNWASATQLTGEPTPRPSGSKEKFILRNLIAGTTYYVGIKTADEKPNWSALSNVLKKTTCSSRCWKPGNIDGSGDGAIDLMDLTLLSQYLTGTLTDEAICFENCNCDGSPDGRIDLGDFTALIDFFAGKYKLPSCQ